MQALPPQFDGINIRGSLGESTPQYNRMPPRTLKMPDIRIPERRTDPRGPWMPPPFPPRDPWRPPPFPPRDPWRKNQNIPQPGGYYPQPPSSPTYPEYVYPRQEPRTDPRGPWMPSPFSPRDPWRQNQNIPQRGGGKGGSGKGGRGGSYTQPNVPFGYGRTPDMSYRFGGRGRPSNMYDFNNPHYQAYEGYQPDQPPPDLPPPPDQPPPDQPPPDQPPPYGGGGGKGGSGKGGRAPGGGQLPGNQLPGGGRGKGAFGGQLPGGGQFPGGGQLPGNQLPGGGQFPGEAGLEMGDAELQSLQRDWESLMSAKDNMNQLPGNQLPGGGQFRGSSPFGSGNMRQAVMGQPSPRQAQFQGIVPMLGGPRGGFAGVGFDTSNLTPAYQRARRSAFRT